MIGEPDSRCRLPMQDSHLAKIPATTNTIDRHPSAQGQVPFVVQYGRSLFFLTWETSRWTLAELEFDATSCTFVEQRRTYFEWPREAFGVLLSRFTLVERVETSLLQRTSDDFTRWLGSQFQLISHPS